MDLKVDSATNDTMRVLKQTIKSYMFPFETRAIIGIPGFVGADVCKAIVRSFGIPSVTPSTLEQIVNSLIWRNLGQGFSVYFAETNPILLPGAGLIIILGGITFLLPSLANPLIVPAFASLMLTLACDLTLILLRAFRKCTHQCLGHPLMKDIKEAAYAYRGFSKEVHKSIKGLVPNYSTFGTLRYDKIKIGYSGILPKYIKDFVES